MPGPTLKPGLPAAAKQRAPPPTPPHTRRAMHRQIFAASGVAGVVGPMSAWGGETVRMAHEARMAAICADHVASVRSAKVGYTIHSTQQPTYRTPPSLSPPAGRSEAHMRLHMTHTVSSSMLRAARRAAAMESGRNRLMASASASSLSVPHSTPGVSPTHPVSGTGSGAGAAWPGTGSHSSTAPPMAEGRCSCGSSGGRLPSTPSMDFERSRLSAVRAVQASPYHVRLSFTPTGRHMLPPYHRQRADTGACTWHRIGTAGSGGKGASSLMHRAPPSLGAL